MKSRVLLLIVLFFPLVLGSGEGLPTGQRLLEKADVRFYPKEGSWNLKIQTENPEHQKLEYQFDVYIKGYQNQTAVWSAPATSRGDVALKMNRVIYHKQAKWPKPQIMSYEAVFVDSAFSFGDVMNANLADDYTVVANQPVMEQGLQCERLTLEPKHKGLYAKIEVTIEIDTWNTLKRTYFTASGEKEKESVFSQFAESGGKIMGFHVAMTNLLLELESTATIDQIKAETIPAFLFDPQGLGRIHAK